MSRRKPISKSELEVARTLWSLGEATPREVYEAFPNQRQVDFATVQTFLRRLEAKGYIRARRKGRVKTYRSRVQPTNVIEEKINEFIDLLFDGESLPLMHHLINRGVSPEEIREFRQLLDEYEKRADDC